jgi:hypothetical protein
MNPNACFIKTPKGVQEIKSREFGLSVELRSVLIVIDGRRTAQQIEKQFSKIGNIRLLFETLQTEGFIELQTISGDAPPKVMLMAGSVPKRPRTIIWKKIKAGVGVQIKQHFGLMAGPLLNQLEKCATLEAISLHVTHCRALIQESFSGKKADAFWDSVNPLVT